MRATRCRAAAAGAPWSSTLTRAAGRAAGQAPWCAGAVMINHSSLKLSSFCRFALVVPTALRLQPIQPPDKRAYCPGPVVLTETFTCQRSMFLHGILRMVFYAWKLQINKSFLQVHIAVCAMQGRGQAGSPSGGGSAPAKKRKAAQADEPITIPEAPSTAPGFQSLMHESGVCSGMRKWASLLSCTGACMCVHARRGCCTLNSSTQAYCKVAEQHVGVMCPQHMNSVLEHVMMLTFRLLVKTLASAVSQRKLCFARRRGAAGPSGGAHYVQRMGPPSACAQRQPQEREAGHAGRRGGRGPGLRP